MWEWKGSQPEPIPYHLKRFGVHSEERCFVCGQYFCKDDDVFMICMPHELRNKNERLKENKIAHAEHWREFCVGITSDAALAAKVTSHKIPKKAPFTEGQIRCIKAFESACAGFGFRIPVQKPYGMRFRKNKTSLTLTYNVYWHHVGADYGGQKGLMGGLQLQELASKTWNRMNELLGIDARDEFTVAGVLSKAASDANAMLDGKR